MSLRPKKRVLVDAGAVAGAVSLGIGGTIAAVVHASAESGTEHVQIVSTSATASTSMVIANGVFTDYGVDHPGSSVDTVTLQKGSFEVAHSKGTGTHSFNPTTCLGTVNEDGTFTISHGTGSYAGISGHGTYEFSLLFVGAHTSAGCSPTSPPVAFQQVITASGPVSLP